MRILTSRFARARGEEGATAVIVALSLIALFGMVVLVVDVGGLLLRRRELVNGSDAAALAAAKTCVLTADARQPEVVADIWAADNAANVTTGSGNIVQIANCDGGTNAPNGFVTVRYQAPQNLFFAPVLGYPSNGTVTTEATAIWGPPGSLNPMPIVVYSETFNSCRLDQDPTPGAVCYIWEDNSSTVGPQSAFGLLDLRTDDPSRYGWDSIPGAQCSDAGNGPLDWISNYPSPDIGDLPTNYPDPTYVCRSNGMQNSAWNALEQYQGEILYFPVNRCHDAPTGNETDGQISSSVTPVACGGTPHQYDIIGFVAFRLIDMFRPNDPGLAGQTLSCPATGAIQRGFPGNFPLLLDALGCYTGTPTINSNSVQVTPVAGGNLQRGNDGQTCTQNGRDWCYDPVGRRIIPNPNSTFTGNVNVSFTYTTPGPCGIEPPGNNSAHCLVVEYVDIQIGGSGPGTGNPDSNVRAYKLCEPTVASTCAPINVPVP